MSELVGDVAEEEVLGDETGDSPATPTEMSCEVQVSCPCGAKTTAPVRLLSNGDWWLDEAWDGTMRLFLHGHTHRAARSPRPGPDPLKSFNG